MFGVVIKLFGGFIYPISQGGPTRSPLCLRSHNLDEVEGVKQKALNHSMSNVL